MDRGNALLEYAALLLVVVCLGVMAFGPFQALPGHLRGAVHRALDSAGDPPGAEETPDGGAANPDSDGTTISRDLALDGDWRLDPAAAAEAVLRCAHAVPAPTPPARVDCALALLGMLDSPVLEATVLRLQGDELYELFLHPSFTSTAVARAAVRTLWEHAGTEALRRLSRTRTFGFLEAFVDSPHHDWVLVFVRAGGDHVRAAIERNGTSPRRTNRHSPIP